MGDAVWIWTRGEGCTTASQPGVVTRVYSPQTVKVDSISQHVRDLRHCNRASTDDASPPDVPDTDNDSPVHIDTQVQQTQAHGDQTSQQH